MALHPADRRLYLEAPCIVGLSGSDLNRYHQHTLFILPA